MIEVAAYLVGINLITFGAFLMDKRRAVRGEWRVRESTLLTLAAFGGSVGAVLARPILRHKTRKEPFRTQLLAIVALQFAGLAAIALLR